MSWKEVFLPYYASGEMPYMLASVGSAFVFCPNDVPAPAPDTPPLAAPALPPAPNAVPPVLGELVLSEVLPCPDRALPMGGMVAGTPVDPAFGDESGGTTTGDVCEARLSLL